MVFYTFYNAIKTLGNRKKEDDTFLSKKTEEKQKGVTMEKGKRKKGKKDRFFCKVEIRRGIV